MVASRSDGFYRDMLIWNKGYDTNLSTGILQTDNYQINRHNEPWCSFAFRGCRIRVTRIHFHKLRTHIDYTRTRMYSTHLPSLRTAAPDSVRKTHCLECAVEKKICSTAAEQYNRMSNYLASTRLLFVTV